MWGILPHQYLTIQLGMNWFPSLLTQCLPLCLFVFQSSWNLKYGKYREALVMNSTLFQTDPLASADPLTYIQNSEWKCKHSTIGLEYVARAEATLSLDACLCHHIYNQSPSPDTPFTMMFKDLFLSSSSA